MTSTLMFDDWFIQSGKRVYDTNFPQVAELRSHHRMTYTARKEANKWSAVGRWGGGVPASIGGILFLGFPLHDDARGGLSLQTGIIPRPPH